MRFSSLNDSSEDEVTELVQPAYSSPLHTSPLLEGHDDYSTPRQQNPPHQAQSYSTPRQQNQLHQAQSYSSLLTEGDDYSFSSLQPNPPHQAQSYSSTPVQQRRDNVAVMIQRQDSDPSSSSKQWKAIANILKWQY